MRHSYSSIKLFEQCPRQYYHKRVLRDVVDEATEAMTYGTNFHEAAEFYIRENKPLDERFLFAKSVLDSLKQFPGERYCEYEMGLTEDLLPCEFTSPDVWFRGIVDLLIINGPEARIIDYKTGASAKYADPDQLELMALCVFKHFPQVTKVKAGLLFVVCNAFPKAKFEATKQDLLWSEWKRRVHKIELAMENDTWNPRPSGLCKKHCSVLTCSHNGRA